MYFRIMNNEDIIAISELLNTPRKIAIIPHRSPDGDAMGSTLSLYHFLLKLNHQPVVISPNDIPSYLNWMPAVEKVMIYENDRKFVANILKEAEIVFTLDFNALHRTGDMEEVLKELSVPFIMIDHHQKPDSYATYMYSSTSFGSTCEMMYNFYSYLNKSDLIDKTIATCIYTGIVTDSGSFRYPSTTSKTHSIVAELLQRGVNNSEIHTLLFDNNSCDRLLLLGRALQNMKVRPERKTAYITLTQQELDEFNFVKGDTEGFVNYGLTIKGIIFAAIFIEHKDEKIIKISFRSQGAFDVNQFAREHFNGGGHINAAGGKSFLSLRDTVHKFETILKDLDI